MKKRKANKNKNNSRKCEKQQMNVFSSSKRHAFSNALCVYLLACLRVCMRTCERTRMKDQFKSEKWDKQDATTEKCEPIIFRIL